MTSEAVSAIANHLERIDADWRKAAGYTGRPVHRRAYWRNMAARILADSIKSIATQERQPTKPAKTNH